MREFIKIAFRNIFRNRRRSLLTGLMMFFCAFVIILSLGGARGIQEQLFSTTVALDLGHLRVAALDEDDDEIIIEQPQIVRNNIEENISGTVFPRLFSQGTLIYSSNQTYGSIYGIQPERERELFRRILPPEQGSFFETDIPRGIYISSPIAGELNIEKGNSLTLMAQNPEGGTNALDFNVIGIFGESAPWLEGNVYIHIDDMQELLMTEGMSWFKITVPEIGGTETIAEELNHDILSDFEVRAIPWQEEAGLFSGMLITNRVSVIFLIFILFLVGGAAVMNTMVMAVYERTNEIGMMLAMGTRRRHLMLIFFIEAFILGTIATIFGLVLGGGVVSLIAVDGISAPFSAMRYWLGGDRFYPVLSTIDYVITYLVVVGICILATLYPARSASSSEPVAALDYV